MAEARPVALITVVRDTLAAELRSRSRVHLIESRGVLPDASLSGNERSHLEAAAQQAVAGDISVVLARSTALGYESYTALRDPICRASLGVKVIAFDAGIYESLPNEEMPRLDDVGMLRAIPRLAVFAPADGPSTRNSLRASLDWKGPVYLRIAGGEVTDGPEWEFAPGRAGVLTEGSDLTIASYGRPISMALEVSTRLRQAGVTTRVLDMASLKPFDEKALLRAARDTGALLTLEDHTPLTGLGALVSSVTSEHYPVPVRKLGVPDLFPSLPLGPSPWERLGLGSDAILDEAWELLRLRGKVQ